MPGKMRSASSALLTLLCIGLIHFNSCFGPLGASRVARTTRGQDGQKGISSHRQSVFTVVTVTSPAQLPQRRSWQREQWSRSMELLRNFSEGDEFKFIYRFCIGKQNLSANTLANLHAEQKQFGDLQMLDSLDYDHQPFQQIGALGTSATTMKVLAAAKWAVQTFQFQYLVRLGDDAYFKPDAFLRQYVSKVLPISLACICFVVPSMTYQSAAGEVKAPYPSGMGFVITYDVAVWLSLAQNTLLWGAPEDGMVGLWLAGTRVQLYHHDGFRDVGWKCQSEDILVHVLRDQASWDRIDAKGNIPCGDSPRPFYDKK